MKAILTQILAVSLALGGTAAAKPLKQDSLRTTSSSFADCIVDKHRAAARAMIVEAPANSEIVKRYKNLIDSACMINATDKVAYDGVAFAGDTFVFTIADALVRADYPQTGPASFTDRAPLTHRRPDPLDERALLGMSQRKQEARRKGHEHARAWSLLSAFGECAVRIDPETARQVALTPANSPAENVLLRKLAPKLAPCADQGSEIKFTPLQLRGTLARNYARLAATSPVPATGAR